ncbi:MAG: hypothetical protein ABI783_08330, partial [Actinomycetota bacterium]
REPRMCHLSGTRRFPARLPTTRATRGTGRVRTASRGFGGFQSPIPQSSYAAGSTTPVKFALTKAVGAKISDSAAQALVAGCKVKVGLDAAAGCATYNAKLDFFQFDIKTPKNASAGSHLVAAVVFAPDGSGLVNRETVSATIRR